MCPQKQMLERCDWWRRPQAKQCRQPLEDGKGEKRDSPLELTADILILAPVTHFEALISRTLRLYICIALSHQLCSGLLQ